MFVRTLTGLITAAMLGGCVPLPIPHTEQVAPAVHGRMYREDGSPIAGRVVASAHYGGMKACQRQSDATTTDADGEFTLPPYERHRSIFWFTMMENFGMTAYTLCAGAVNDTLGRRADVLGGYIKGGNEVECLEWSADGVGRLSCGSEESQFILVGGEWRSGSTGGTLRLIRNDEFDPPFYSVGHLQWMAHDPVTGRDRVHATVAIPTLDREISLSSVTFVERDGRWFLQTTAGMKSWPFGHRKVLEFEIGGPGEVWRIPDGRT